VSAQVSKIENINSNPDCSSCFYPRQNRQLNENWPTGGWGVIEYGLGTDDGSQIFGGRLKPLMHLLQSSLFRNQIVACGKDRNCYIRNDGIVAIQAIVEFEAWNAGSTEKPNNTYRYTAMVDPGTIHWFDLPSALTISVEDIILIKLLQQEEIPMLSTAISESVYLQAMPKDISGLEKTTKIEILSMHHEHHAHPDFNGSTAIIELQSDRLATFVVLTTKAQGRFTDNCFTLRPMEQKVR
jgi:hypothetical protein